MDYSRQKTFTIHFPNKKVYIENTCKTVYDKMEQIKDNKDHQLYDLLQEFPNPEIRVEYYQSKYNSRKLVADKYLKDNYKILNVNLFPPPRFNLLQSLYKWMGY